MTTYRFQKVQCQFEQTGQCPTCLKRVTRRRTFTQTVNPFNRNDDGSVKTSAEVYAAVKAEGEAWQPDFTHEACR